MITPEQIKTFGTSSRALDAIKSLGRAISGPLITLTQTEFVLVRDFLITSIAVANANRSGVLTQLTLDEFKQAKSSGDTMILSVRVHKTSYKYGPAKLIVNSHLFIIG